MGQAPATFVVARAVLSRGVEATSALSKQLALPRSSVHRVLADLRDRTAWQRSLLLDEMLHAVRRPSWRQVSFYAPNPPLYRKQYPGAALSGEHGAEVLDGLDLVSRRCRFYIRLEDFHDAMVAATDIGARHAHPGQANLTIRIADPWLRLDEGVVEPGQRYYDYATSDHIYLRYWRPDGVLSA